MQARRIKSRSIWSAAGAVGDGATFDDCRDREEDGPVDPARAVANPGSTRDLLAESILKRPKDSVRVLVGDIGGGFGQKTSLYPEDGIVAYAATKLNRKIRWRGDRTDEFVGGTHGRDLPLRPANSRSTPRAACWPIACARSAAPGRTRRGPPTSFPLVLGPFVQTGVYDLPLVHFEVKSVMTNTAPIGAYRGARRPKPCSSSSG